MNYVEQFYSTNIKLRAFEDALAETMVFIQIFVTFEKSAKNSVIDVCMSLSIIYIFFLLNQVSANALFQLGDDDFEF